MDPGRCDILERNTRLKQHPVGCLRQNGRGRQKYEVTGLLGSTKLPIAMRPADSPESLVLLNRPRERSIGVYMNTP